MNDHQRFLEFLGTPLQSEELLKSFRDFAAQAKNVQQKLGAKNYLLYRYLEKMLALQTHRYFYDASDEGFEACAKTLRFCNAITEGKPTSEEDTELKTRAIEFYEHNLKKHQDQRTRSALLHINMFPSYIERESANYLDNLVKGLDKSVDYRKTLEYYNEMKNELGGEAELIELHESLEKAFYPVTFMQAYAQSAVNALADHLVTRDDETSKTIIQLLLEA